MNKYLKIILALAMTFIVMKFASMNSRGRPELHTHTENGYTFTMTTVPKGTEFTEETITVEVMPTPPQGSEIIFRRAEKGTDDISNLAGYSSLPMIASDTTTDLYETVVKAGVKAGRFKYYFEVLDPEQKVVASFRDLEKAPFDFRYIGAVPSYILGLHLIFIIGTFFAVSMAALSAVALVTGKSVDTFVTTRWLFWSVLFAFLGGYPFGIPMNWYAFGGTWEGVPFGTDATDNKTQLMLVYLLYAWAAGMKTFSKGKCGKDIYSPKTLGLVGIGGLFFTLAMFAIPHSIQFAPVLTYSVCYGFPALILIIYMVGYGKAGKQN